MKEGIMKSKDIRNELLHSMREGIYASCERLPRESELAQRLNISRTQLRDVLASLEREGFITRRHGVGTVINHHVLNVNTRMDIEIEFQDMIRANGYEPKLAWTRETEVTADEKIANLLGIPVGTQMLQISLLCTADGIPAIYCENYVERARIQAEYTQEDLDHPVFYFLEKCCGIVPYLDLTQLRAVSADAKLAGQLDIQEGNAVLCMEEVDYDLDGKAVFCALEYFRDGTLTHTVMRKKL